MVKHIILWKLKEECNNDSVKEEIKENLEALMGKIPGLVEIKVQTTSLASSNADVMLYSVFEDEATPTTFTLPITLCAHLPKLECAWILKSKIYLLKDRQKIQIR